MNLQQIPSRVGSLIRGAFLSRDRFNLVGIDFGSQELRILADLSRDPVMLDAYARGLDLHSITASSIAEVTYEEFQVVLHWFNPDTPTSNKEFAYLMALGKGEHTTEQKELVDTYIVKMAALSEHDQHEHSHDYDLIRKQAKTVNFGIVYGMASKGLAASLMIDEETAQRYIDAYFARYQGVQKWIEETKKLARKQGFVTTGLGRKRRIEDVLKNKTEPWEIGSALRQAVNFRIQGYAADMTKLAVVNLMPLVKKIGGTIVCYIHDEILFELPDTTTREQIAEIQKVMENAIPLVCGMGTDVEIGKRWSVALGEESDFEVDHEEMLEAA